MRAQQLHACGDPPPELADLAASLTCGIARNHPFGDGDERTTAVACETFIVLGDGVLDPVSLYPVYVALAEGTLSEADFSAWLRPRIRTATPGKVNEPATAYGG